MTILPWRYAFASVAGTSHLRAGLPCQDASRCVTLGTDREELLVAVAADGAGSACRSSRGAELACELLVSEVQALIAGGGAFGELSRDFFGVWLCRFQEAVLREAQAEQAVPRDYACTVLAAIASPEGSVFLQIGDGAIVVGDPDAREDYLWIFWPERGEYENETFFATDPKAIGHMQLEIQPRHLEEIALLTDGLQRLALDYRHNAAHAPFFRPLFAHARTLPPGLAARLCTQLGAYLGSSALAGRTDDDKTLVLATRCPER